MFRAAVPLLVSSLVFVSGGLQAEDERLDQVANDWRKRQQVAETIRYELEGELLRPKGALSPMKVAIEVADPNVDIPEEDRTAPYNILLLVDFAENRMRVEREREILNSGPEFIKEYIIDLYNGEEFQRYMPLDRNERIAELEEAGARMHFELTEITLSAASGMLREFTERPIYWAHGMVPLPGPVEQLRQPVDLSGYRIAGETLHEGQQCLILHSPTRFNGKLYSEIWVDPAKDSAVVRFADIYDGQQDLIYLVDYKQTPHGWLPAEWSADEFGGGQEHALLSHTEMRVANFEIDPAVTNADFHVEPAQGMYVKDARDRKNQKRVIQTAAGQPPLDAVVEWRRKHRPTEAPSSPWPWVLMWGGIGCFGIALLVLGIRAYRAT